MAFLDYVWLVPLLPLAGFGFVLIVGHKTPQKGGYLALALTAVAGVISALALREVLVAGGLEHPFVDRFPLITDEAGVWWSAGKFDVGFGVYIDNLSAIVLALVGVLVTLILVYSIGYMKDEGRNRRRYYAEMSLFIAGMFGLVVSSNFLELFIFWEIMGLCSYLLIGYWFQKPSAASAAKKAFLVTRIGDIFLLTGLVILLVTFGTLDYERLFAIQAEGSQLAALGVANLFIFLGAVGKSAQFPLHVWLPDAMEGPTTVSALIHAATMVKAGVFLVARSYPLMVQTPWVLVVVAVVGGFTALFTATMALTNWDLKRVMAYSTLSQLGYMFLGLGVAGVLFFDAEATTIALAGFTFAILHLVAHAFFKALLFLSAGSVGHAAGTYDMRRMGGLHKHMKVTSVAMLVGALALAGVPPLAGFFSKDELLTSVFHASEASTLYLALFAVGIITAFLTAFYTFRAWFLTFTGEWRGPPEGAGGHHDMAHETHVAEAHGHGADHREWGPAPGVHEDHGVHLHESPASMTGPLVVLAAFAIVAGFVLFVGFPELVHAPGAEAERVELAHVLTSTTALISYGAVGAGIALAWVLFQPSRHAQAVAVEDTGVRAVLARRWYVDDVYDYVGGTLQLRFASAMKWFDESVIDGIVNGTAWASQRGFARGRRTQTGNVQDYATVVIAGALLLIMLVIYVPSLLRFLADRGIIPALGGP